ncbi:hemicentin-2-like isoform X2 [Mya arenaria]|uniref:hemicentin-2-like isoform X2 n=1 Tax=Mya arenaria TaxID=6604 RepID=UPI0022E4756F|nr:hemicentin-2-like isoform X2 [Mya arenaria]
MNTLRIYHRSAINAGITKEYISYEGISLPGTSPTPECTDVVLSKDREFATENETLTMICSTGSGYEFVSFLNETTTIGSIVYTDGICHTNIKTANCSCVNVTTYTCTTNTLTRLNNNEPWRCRATRNGIGIYSNEVSIVVKVPIKTVSISPDILDSITISEGNALRLTCEAANGLPFANISWYLGNKTNGFHDDYYILKSSKREVFVNTDRTLTTKSTLTHTVSRTEDGMDVYCNASNGENHQVSSQTIHLNIEYHPGIPTFKFKSSSIAITARSISVIRNEEISIACITDGNPPPSYTWSTGHDGQIITSAFDRDTNLTCEVSSSLYTTGANSTQSTTVSNRLQIKVLYPPDIPVLWANSTCMKNITFEQNVLQVLELDRVNVKCVAAGIPDPKCQWTNRSQSCTLDIYKVSKDDAGTYVCHASNTMNTSYGSSVVGRNASSFYLDILYPPKIANIHTKVEVIEGVNLSLICNTEPGNPSETSYSWTSTHQPERNTFDQYLNIHNITRTDEGVFTCFVKNRMYPTGCHEVQGSDMEYVYVDVQYKASIKTFAVLNDTVYHGDQFMLSCEVDSDPPSDISISSPTGSILNFTHRNIELNYYKNSSCLDDTGQFTCVSNNRHNYDKPDRRNVTVNVKCPPMYRHNEQPTTVVTTTLGGKAVLYFAVFSNPYPRSIIWRNLTKHTILATDDDVSARVTINTTDDNLTSVVTITNVGNWDSGDYSVIAENEFGILRETFRISIDDHPGLDGNTLTSSIFDNATGPVVGVTIGAVCFVVIVAVLIAIFVYRKRQSGNENDRLREENGLKDDSRYDDIAMVDIKSPNEYNQLDFRSRMENNGMHTPTKDSAVYENMKLTSTKSNALT